MCCVLGDQSRKACPVHRHGGYSTPSLSVLRAHAHTTQGHYTPRLPTVSLGPAAPVEEEKLLIIFGWAGNFFLFNKGLLFQGGGRDLGII